MIIACGTRQQIQKYNLEGDWQVQNANCEEFYRFYDDNVFNHYKYCFSSVRRLIEGSYVRRGIFSLSGTILTSTYIKDAESKGEEHGKDNLVFFQNASNVTITGLDNHNAIILKRVSWIPKLQLKEQ